MSSDQPYNELGQILSTGGEIALGLAILADMPKEGFILFFNRRFMPIRESDRASLMELADSMVEAGANIQAMNLDDILTTADIPINDWLFGGELEGRRVLVTGEVELPGSTRRVQLRLPFVNIPTVHELREAFLDRGLEVAKLYPEKFGFRPGETPEGGNVYILLPERAF